MDPVSHALQQWSVGVQLGTVTLLALFFLAQVRSIRLAEVGLWARAWVSDAVAIAAIFVTSFLHAPSLVAHLTVAVYAAGKTAYVLLLVGGAQYHLRPGLELRLRPRYLALAAGGWGVALSFLAPHIQHVRLAQSLLVGAVLTAGGVWVLRYPRAERSRWLGWALLAQGLLFLHYVPLLAPVLWGSPPLVRYLGVASFFDAAAELFVALGILVALESSTTEHLRHLNDELVASQDRLRQLADLDPLTALANRRTLRDALDRVRPSGATIVFLDIRDFKGINDRFGHIVGDTCLRRVASSLTQVFRADDELFRYGGDEFLVVAPGLDHTGATERMAAVRALLAESSEQAPRVQLAVGIASLPPGGEPDIALREADIRMVADKQAQKDAAGGTVSGARQQ
ncbi:MAG: GGDEF domain-containing protein [Acidobacteriota bacterium]